jgi:DNA-binding GntR family transcriptional regulator
MPDVPQIVLRRHEAVLKAIRQRDPGAARAAMRQHLDETVRLVSQVMEQRQDKTAARKE